MQPSNAATIDFLTERCAALSDDQVRAHHAKAMAAAAIHQAGGRFHMALLCEQRAVDMLAVLDRRQAKAA